MAARPRRAEIVHWWVEGEVSFTDLCMLNNLDLILDPICGCSSKISKSIHGCWTQRNWNGPWVSRSKFRVEPASQTSACHETWSRPSGLLGGCLSEIWKAAHGCQTWRNWNGTWVDIFQNPIWKSFELKSMLLGYRDLSRKCPESIWENPETILENLQHILEWVLKSTATILTVKDVWNIIQEKQNVSQKICKIFWTVLRMIWKTILNTVQKII